MGPGLRRTPLLMPVPGEMFVNHLLLITGVEKVAGLVDINRICSWRERTRMISAKYT